MSTRNRILNAIGMTALMAGIAAPITTQAAPPSDWVHIGTERADFAKDRDVYALDKVDGHVGSLKLTVNARSVSIYSLKLVYEDGGAHQFGIARRFHRPGQTAGTFDNPNPDRRVAYLEIGHRSLDRNYRPQRLGAVAVHARRPFEPPQPPVFEPEELVLGSLLPRRELQTRTLEIGFEQGRFRALRFKAHRRTAVIEGVEVTFGNGRSQYFPTRQVVFRGAQTPELDLNGKRRFIASVKVHYRRSRLDLFRARADRDGRGRPRLEIIGLR